MMLKTNNHNRADCKEIGYYRRLLVIRLIPLTLMKTRVVTCNIVYNCKSMINYRIYKMT